MHKVSIYANVDYIVGHLRYGHYEGDIELNDEEFEEFKKNPKQFLKDNDMCDLELLVDEVEIDDIGNIDNVEYTDYRAT